MFHTYVMNVRGKLIDLNRAQFLMDKELLRQAIEQMEDERDNRPRWDAEYGPQWIFERYCTLHRKKYEESFTPDVDPVWS